MLRLVGGWDCVCRDQCGNILWRERVPNGVCIAALVDLLQVHFLAGTQKTQWFAGLIANTAYSGVSSADTISSHSGWTEYTGYTESVRQQLSTISISSEAVLTLSSPVAFTFTEAATIRGVLVASNSTKGGSTGILWSTAVYASPRSMLAGQTLTWTYTLRASGGSS